MDLEQTTNALRLSWRSWFLAALIVVGLAEGAPRWWERWEPFVPSAAYRVPYALSEDYWHYRRLAREAARQERVLALGDSVIWGEYAIPGQTLTDRLNELSGSRLFVNGGLNGLHPLAIHGLVRHYLAGAAQRRVLLHCNLLWLSSPQRDLREGEENAFNHPRLVPQWYPLIPAYHADLDERLATSVDRDSAVRGWVQHLRAAYFDNQSITAWSLEHPYEFPLHELRGDIPQPETTYRHRTVPWNQQGIRPAAMDWVSLDASWQWRGFRMAVDALRAQTIQPFVVVGPFNEHLLPPDNRATYQALLAEVDRWLTANDIPHCLPELLPSEEYGDASHPLAAGYSRLAAALWADAAFQAWLAPAPPAVRQAD